MEGPGRSGAANAVGAPRLLRRGLKERPLIRLEHRREDGGPIRERMLHIEGGTGCSPSSQSTTALNSAGSERHKETELRGEVDMKGADHDQKQNQTI